MKGAVGQGTHHAVKREKCKQILVRHVQGREHLEYLSVDESIISKRILNSLNWLWEGPHTVVNVVIKL